MMFRHWRIQVSLICFTLFLAVIVLWVRSYSWKDRIGYSTNSIHLPVVSALGYVHFSVRVFVFPPGGPTSEGSWGIESSEITNKMRDTT